MFPKKIFKSAVDSSKVAEYSVDQLKEILKGNENEIRLLSKMRHENIITLFGVSYDKSGDNLPLLVLEGVHCDLCYYLNNSKFISWDEDLMILQGICNGLVYLHEGEGVIHNNISTCSILLSKNLVAKLSSFEHAVEIHKTTSYSSDLLSLGEVISVILIKYLDTNNADEESAKQLMMSLFELCTNTQSEGEVTSSDILKRLNNHKK